jgi:hypothetical protein
MSHFRRIAAALDRVDIVRDAENRGSYKKEKWSVPFQSDNFGDDPKNNAEGSQGDCSENDARHFPGASAEAPAAAVGRGAQYAT